MPKLTQGVTYGLSHPNSGHRPTSHDIPPSLPGYRYWPPNPASLTRPTGHAERFAVYDVHAETTPLHFHSMAEISLVRTGAGTMRVGGHSFPIETHLMSLATPNTPHCQVGVADKSVCMFDLGLVAPLLERDQITGHLSLIGSRYPSAVVLSADEVAPIANLFSGLMAEKTSSTLVGSGTATAALVAQLLVKFVRIAITRHQTTEPTPLPSVDPDLGRAMTYIQDHFTEPINRSTVAKALGLRPEMVSRLFQKGSASTFGAYLSGLRVGHALELLQSTDLNAADIAKMSGFESYRTFARRFQLQLGVSPNRFRPTPR